MNLLEAKEFVTANEKKIEEALSRPANFRHTNTEDIQSEHEQLFCPRCHSPLKRAVSISGSPSTDWLECTSKTCNTYVDTYRPMPHQTSVHTDAHRIIGNFGSYGTGKTKTSEKEIEKHIFLTPNANILLGANITTRE